MILIMCNDSSQTSIGFLLNYMKWYVTQEGSGAEKKTAKAMFQADIKALKCIFGAEDMSADHVLVSTQ